MNLLKERYNELIKVEKEVGRWLDNGNVPIEERDKRMPAYRRIINNLNTIIKELKQQGIEVSNCEILDGFKVESEVKNNE